MSNNHQPITLQSILKYLLLKIMDKEVIPTRWTSHPHLLILFQVTMLKCPQEVELVTNQQI